MSAAIAETNRSVGGELVGSVCSNSGGGSGLTASLLLNGEGVEDDNNDDGMGVLSGDDFVVDLMDTDDDELFLYREGRAVGFYIQFLQWCLFFVLLTCCAPVVYVYAQTIERKCDLHLKIWSTVWLSRAVTQTFLNLLITRRRLLRRTVPSGLFALVRILHMLGISWAFLGIYVIFGTPHCEGPATFALIVSRGMFWFTAAIIIVPIALYILLLLCLPLLIYFLVRFSVPHADRQPTPPAVLSQLEVKTFRDVVTGLRTQYNIEPIPRGVSSTLTNVLDNMSALLGGGGSTTAGTTTTAGSTVGHTREPGVVRGTGPSIDVGCAGAAGVADGVVGYKAVGGVVDVSNMDDVVVDNRPAGCTQRPTVAAAPSTITINRACPICMVDMDDSDEVMVMPCDGRHFFHKPCVEQWLEGSQACPICRANIVSLLTGTSTTGAHATTHTAGGGGAGSSTSIEMRS
eukprot:GHVS01106368.1.p1 GENE.GHVS01106368.1~~GHVS01106368.1.p1  ORF type:complete len:459 (-),score=93.93 GHVS01106368.1:297-1673(-)